MPVIAEGTQFIMSIGTIVGVILFAVTMAINFTNFKSGIEYKVKANEITNCLQQKQIDKTIEKINNNDVIVMEIKTKLANIEVLLIDMKTQIKEKK